jgi:antitoxin ParD1/3/4
MKSMMEPLSVSSRPRLSAGWHFFACETVAVSQRWWRRCSPCSTRDSQVAGGRYSSASEYVRELIRADERRQAQDALEAALLEGLASPEALLDAEDWSAIRMEAVSRLTAREQRV